MHVEVKQLRKTFGSYTASDDVSFDIEKGKLIGLLGPSGGGKTTILRMLAGLEQPDSGEIVFNGKRVNDLPPQERSIGFVFQNYALFRHMNVFDNIAFGLTVKKWKKAAIAARVQELLELTGLKGLEKRYPNQLSGGQRQRVAFARALAPEPELLLLDEPFAAIDAKVRKELRSWLKETIRRVGITTVFVTHDQEEAMEVADEIMIIQGGRLEQKGAPLDIYSQPETPFVARFVGESRVLEQPGSIKGFADYEAHAKAIVRPEFIEAGRRHELSQPLASEEGIIRDTLFCGSRWQLEVEVGPHRLTVYRSLEKPALSAGEAIWVMIHRLYLYEGPFTGIAENALKADEAVIGLG
ncbi:sulfate/molybdate ABC transporter ATP-binding protein [Gorillibacterium sp. sgz5001074]|uniref:sulfate/molybdate ABC transporter ATP-binding protein n=1 Tax=Gorillibacterium sp. sgz5001074 TaxID=3446695 RepID=UPI003F6760D4